MPTLSSLFIGEAFIVLQWNMKERDGDLAGKFDDVKVHMGSRGNVWDG
jgi:hypothetical protein